MLPKYYEMDKNTPALKKAEFNSLLKTVKNSSFNLKDNDNPRSEKNFVKRSLLDIALSNNEVKDEESNESNLNSNNNEVPTEEVKTNIIDQGEQNIEELDLNSEIDENNEAEKEKIFEEKLKKVEEDAYSKGKHDGILEGHQKGIDEARKQSEEGLEAAISSFRIASEKIINSDENILSKLHSSIENSILGIAKEYAGFCIDEMPEKFIKRIEKLTKIINKNISNISIKINASDYKTILPYIDNDETLKLLKFHVDDNFKRGDIRLNSGGIQIDEIFEAAEVSQFSSAENHSNKHPHNIETFEDGTSDATSPDQETKDDGTSDATSPDQETKDDGTSDATTPNQEDNINTNDASELNSDNKD